MSTELDPSNIPAKDSTEQIVNFPKQKKLETSRPKPHRGMTLWEVDMTIEEPTEKDFHPATYELTTLPMTVNTQSPFRSKHLNARAKAAQLTLVNTQVRHRLMAKVNHYYTWAINQKNALKRFHQDLD